MRVVVADGAVKFAQDFDLGKLFLSSIESCDNVRDLLAERGRASGLTVRSGQHGQIGILFRESVELVAQAPHLWDQYV